jgi:hypothetical protein
MVSKKIWIELKSGDLEGQLSATAACLLRYHVVSFDLPQERSGRGIVLLGSEVKCDSQVDDARGTATLERRFLEREAPHKLQRDVHWTSA